MILEVAEISVADGTQTDFENALRDAVWLVEATEGYIRHHLRRSLEEPTRYILFIHWENLGSAHCELP